MCKRQDADCAWRVRNWPESSNEHCKATVNATIGRSVYSTRHQQRSQVEGPNRSCASRAERFWSKEKLLAGYKDAQDSREKAEAANRSQSDHGANSHVAAADKLQPRPVEKGQVLLTVADPTKDWDLEIQDARGPHGAYPACHARSRAPTRWMSNTSHDRSRRDLSRARSKRSTRLPKSMAKRATWC